MGFDPSQPRDRDGKWAGGMPSVISSADLNLGGKSGSLQAIPGDKVRVILGGGSADIPSTTGRRQIYDLQRQVGSGSHEITGDDGKPLLRFTFGAHVETGEDEDGSPAQVEFVADGTKVGLSPGEVRRFVKSYERSSASSRIQALSGPVDTFLDGRNFAIRTKIGAADPVTKSFDQRSWRRLDAAHQAIQEGYDDAGDYGPAGADLNSLTVKTNAGDIIVSRRGEGEDVTVSMSAGERDDWFITHNLTGDPIYGALERLEESHEALTLEAFDPSAHPRAAAGTAGGGQFAAGGGAAAAKKTATPAKAAAKKGDGDTLSFDAKSGRGAGYGKAGGDARVSKLQTALNRLGLTDASGKKLAVDGKLGPLTTQAVKAAQRKLGVPADGKVTPALLAQLASAKSLTKTPAKTAAKPVAKKVTPVNAAPGKTPPAKKAMPARAGQSRAREADMDDDTTESVDRIDGRVLEAKDGGEGGSRVFRVRIISAGDSKNNRRYPARVLQESVGLYEGAKAYDHHRTDAELRSSTINGLVGYYRNVEASGDGLDGDLCLLPSATHTAEALDATLAAQAVGLPPLVGISHDAVTFTRPIAVGRRRLQEAVSIAKVNSADVVADPAAGGKATRVLAGGIEETDPEDSGESNEEDDVPLTSQTVLAALKDASPEDLAAVGLSKASEPVVETATTEAVEEGVDKASFLGGLMIREKVTGAGLPERVAESLRESLPDRITESDVDGQIAALKSIMGVAERSGLAPTVTAQVTQEALDKKKAALDGFFSGDYSGYRSFRQAYLDITGNRTAAFDASLNKRIMRESIGGHYDSADAAERATESMTTASWDVILGDSITRRMVAMYTQPSLQNWRQVVSSVVPVNDFRTQRIDRLGGYGVLPAVNQGAPYQPLTSPTDEEVTYALSKRGGTEDLTLEMVANDDVRAIGNIPKRLGLAAARTLHNFVWDFFSTNPTIYDALALFHATHNNTTAVALSQSAVSTLRGKMRDQTGYGDTSNILSMVPKILVVPNELEELAYQIVSSAVAIPSTPAGPTDTPNLHQGMSHLVVDYFTDANDWFLVADPQLCPTIEIGFYQGEQEPALFTQSDQTVGSMFNADKLTYKIRHIYSGAALEFRGLQRGTQ